MCPPRCNPSVRAYRWVCRLTSRPLRVGAPQGHSRQPHPRDAPKWQLRNHSMGGSRLRPQRPVDGRTAHMEALLKLLHAEALIAPQTANGGLLKLGKAALAPELNPCLLGSFHARKNAVL